MNENRPSWLLVVGGGVVVGLLLVACVGVFLWLASPLGGIMGGSRFESNGAQIYFTGTSQRGTPITAQRGAGMGRMRGVRLTCASCHGPDGRGGQVQMMMRIIEVPDIRYDLLTGEDHGEGEAHEPYTEETIKRAITEGVEPDGEPLEWPMPRWSMSDEDLDDLVAFLKTLD
jgi:mono/diheme cytochrome c family protein